MARRWYRGAFAAVVALATVAHGATIVVVNQDSPGEGFNDPAPVAAVGGNPGTTLGGQRLKAFQYAADIWAATLVSGVTIDVDATMDPLSCDATSATLGQAGPTSVVRDFPDAISTGTWYAVALANKLAGTDLAADEGDVTAQFNDVIGTTCPFAVGWYYGLDGNAPPNTIDFVTVVLHELAHGLGFLTLVDDVTGAEFQNHPDAFERYLTDDGVGWTTMSDAQRQWSAVHSGHLVWTGPAVLANAGTLTSGRDASGNVLLYAPDPVEEGSSVSHWDTSLVPDQLLEPVYTTAIHEPSLALLALADIGWNGGATTTTTAVDGTTTSTTLPLDCPPSPNASCHTATHSSIAIHDRPFWCGARGCGPT